MIVFKIAGVGGSEKPAFKDIAICVKGRWQMETIAEVEVRRTCRRARPGCNWGLHARSHFEGGASADGHCRPWHNIAAGCCVASGETFTILVAVASARGVTPSVYSSSFSSGTGVSVGESDAGLTVVLVLEGMDVRNCSRESGAGAVAVCPPWEPKSGCDRVTGDCPSVSNPEPLPIIPVSRRNFRSSLIKAWFVCCD